METHKDPKDVEENNSSMDNTGEKVAAKDTEDATEEKGDKYFNCKNAEFYLYSIFSVTTIFEEVTVQFETQSTVELADALKDHAEAEGVEGGHGSDNSF